MNTLSRKDFKISFTNERYEKKGRKVFCTLIYRLMEPSGNYVRILDDGILHVAKGVAICADEDEFDYSIGKKIARTRAENKAYSQTMKHLTKVEDELKDILRKISPVEFDYDIADDYKDIYPDTTFTEKAGGCIEHNCTYINEQAEKAKPYVKPELDEVAPKNFNKTIYRHYKNNDLKDNAYKKHRDLYQNCYHNYKNSYYNKPISETNKEKVLYEKHTPNCDIKVTSKDIDGTELRKALDRLFGKFWLF